MNAKEDSTEEVISQLSSYGKVGVQLKVWGSSAGECVSGGSTSSVTKNEGHDP